MRSRRRDRLSESYSGRTILGAHEAAYVALSGVLEASFLPVDTVGNLTHADPQMRREVVAKIRTFLAKRKRRARTRALPPAG